MNKYHQCVKQFSSSSRCSVGTFSKKHLSEIPSECHKNVGDPDQANQFESKLQGVTRGVGMGVQWLSDFFQAWLGCGSIFAKKTYSSVIWMKALYKCIFMYGISISSLHVLYNFSASLYV